MITANENKYKTEKNNRLSEVVIIGIFLLAIIVFVFYRDIKTNQEIKKNQNIQNIDSVSMLVACNLATCRNDMEDLVSKRINTYSEIKNKEIRKKIDKELDDLDKLLDFPDDKRVMIQWFLPPDSSSFGNLKDFDVKRLLVRDTDGKILVDVNF